MPSRRTILIFLIFIIFCEKSVSSPHLNILQSFSTPNVQLLEGNTDSFIPLIKGGQGFYVTASVPAKNNKYDSTIRNGEYQKNMMIFLFSSRTLLPQTCESFIPYDCDQFACEIDPGSSVMSTFPSFVAHGYKIRSNIHLGNFWKLNDRGLMSISCSEGLLYRYGEEVYGALGFGIAGGGETNFQGTIFSIYIDKMITRCELWFSKNLEKSQSGIPVATMNCTENWNINGIEGMNLGNITLDYNFTETRIIPDLNKKTLGLPSLLFRKLITALQRTTIPIKCKQSPYLYLNRPKCTYNGNLRDLPNITLTVQGQVLSISLLDYVDNPDNYSPTRGWIILNINAHEYGAKIPENFVTKSFENYIILDQHFMAEYYLVFNFSGPNIEFHVANHDLPQDNSINIKVLLVLIGSVVLLLLILILIVIWQNWKESRNPKSGLLQNQDENRQDPRFSITGINDAGESRIYSNEPSQIHLMKESRQDKTPPFYGDRSHEDSGSIDCRLSYNE